MREVSAGYGELNLVEAPAIELLKTLGWQHADLFKEKIGRLGTEGRESESQVILPNRLRAALQRLNPGLPSLAYELAFDVLNAVDAIVASDNSKAQFMALAGFVAKHYKAILPDTRAADYAPKTVALAFLARQVKALMPPVDISEVMNDIEALLDDSIATDGYHISASGMAKALGSEIDFEAFDAEFKKSKRKHLTAEQLKGAVEQKVNELAAKNPSREGLVEKLKKLIDAYNSGDINIEAYVEELKQFTKELTAEEQRGVALGLSEEELAVFDILTQPDPPLTPEQEQEVRRLAKELLTKLKAEKLILDWRLKQQARAAVQKTIRDIFRTLAQPYNPDLRQEKAARAYSFVYDNLAG